MTNEGEQHFIEFWACEKKINLWLSQMNVSYKQVIIHNEWHNDFSHFLWQVALRHQWWQITDKSISKVHNGMLTLFSGWVFELYYSNVFWALQFSRQTFGAFSHFQNTLIFSMSCRFWKGLLLSFNCKP